MFRLAARNFAARNIAVRSVAAPRIALAARTRFVPCAAFSAAAGLSKEEITQRVLDVLKGFEKVDPSKVLASALVLMSAMPRTKYLQLLLACTYIIILGRPWSRQSGCCRSRYGCRGGWFYTFCEWRMWFSYMHRSLPSRSLTRRQMRSRRCSRVCLDSPRLGAADLTKCDSH